MRVLENQAFANRSMDKPLENNNSLITLQLLYLRKLYLEINYLRSILEIRREWKVTRTLHIVNYKLQMP